MTGPIWVLCGPAVPWRRLAGSVYVDTRFMDRELAARVLDGAEANLRRQTALAAAEAVEVTRETRDDGRVRLASELTVVEDSAELSRVLDRGRRDAAVVANLRRAIDRGRKVARFDERGRRRAPAVLVRSLTSILGGVR